MGSYTTSLQVQFYDTAERWYVEDGLSPQAIANKLQEEHGDDAPSRRTIYNWMKEGDWGEKRKQWLTETEDIDLSLREAIRVAIENAIENPNRNTFSALKNVLNGAKTWQQLQGLERAAATEDSSDKEKGDVARDALDIVKQALEGR